MRRLKIQMNISADGFVGGQNGELNWLTTDWDDKVKTFCIRNLEKVDFILMTFGKKPDPSFITYWDATAQKPEDPYYEVAMKIAATPKVVLTEYATNLKFPNTEIIHGNIIDEVKRLKAQEGYEIMVYAGVRLVSSLIENDLVDEFDFLVNPVVIGKGLSVFDRINDKLDLEPRESLLCECGIIINEYVKNKTDYEIQRNT